MTNYSELNIYNNSLVIISILLFYLLPFCIIQKNSFLSHIQNNKRLILIFFILFFIIYLIDQLFFTNLINFSPRGGGVFMKIAIFNKIDPTLFLSIISFISLIVLDYFFREKRFQNYSLLIILIISFPIYTIYQKYFDPLFFLFFFGLIKSSVFKNIFLKDKNFLFPIFIYFSFFYIFALFHYSKGFY